MDITHIESFLNELGTFINILHCSLLLYTILLFPLVILSCFQYFLGHMYSFCPTLTLFPVSFSTISGDFATMGRAFCARLSKMPALHYHQQHFTLGSAYSVNGSFSSD